MATRQRRTRKRGRPTDERTGAATASLEFASYTPPPPPPPPPANNPFYQRFFEDYWKNHPRGRGQGGGCYSRTPPPPPFPATTVAGAAHASPGVVARPSSVRRETAPQATAARIVDTSASGSLSRQEEYPTKTDRETFVLATPSDPNYLSEKQCYVRTRLCEIFLASKSDVERLVRGRRAAFVGQVGLRCVFCVPSVNARDRADRAICYPTVSSKFYQTAQDMQHFHFGSCGAIPQRIRETYQGLRSSMNHRRGIGESISPREYWTRCCADLGIVDHIDGNGNSNGVRVKEGHKLMPRSSLNEYARELFMPPEEGDDIDREMTKVLATEVKVGGSEGGRFDKLVADLDGKASKEGTRQNNNSYGSENIRGESVNDQIDSHDDSDVDNRGSHDHMQVPDQ